MLNVIFIFQVQDGEQQRFEYQTEVFEGAVVPIKEINARGDELNRERFPEEELAKGFYWDESMERAGRYYKYVVISDAKSFKIIQGIMD